MGVSLPVLAFMIVMHFTHFFTSWSAEANDTYHYSPAEVNAMQQLYSAWDKGTPDLEINLPGWNNSKNSKPCDSGHPWQGVRCLWKQWINDSTHWDVNIVSMRLTAASLVGNLPSAIGNLSYLATLGIVQNPKLTGTLPDLDNLQSLNSLKFTSNGLNGSIPQTIASSAFLQVLDLSDNNFLGELPANLLSTTVGLQSLNISWNLLSGVINQTMFQSNPSLFQVDFSHNNFSGPLPDFTRSLNYLDFSSNNFRDELPNLAMMQPQSFLNLSNNQLYGEINLTAKIFNITASPAVVDLSHNGFVGSLPNLSSLTNLETLDLSNNSFSPGPFPDWITSLTDLTSLSLDGNNIHGTLDISILNMSLHFLSLKNNNISIVSYKGLIQDLKIILNLQGNPYCSNSTKETDLKRCACQQLCVDTSQLAEYNTKDVIIISTVVSGVLLAFTLLIASLLLWKTKREQRYLLLEVQQKFLEYEVKPTVFTYNELRVATRDFHPDLKLGEGSFGAVYKGTLANGTFVAVKQLFNTSIQKNIDDFLNEVVLVTAVKHRNLVNLKGCCLRRDQRLLVYEYIENYDLSQVLFDHKGGFTMTWSIRLNICLGVAHGLHYLHALSQPRIIHRDIKASNVLLNKNFEAKIADFGLALLFPDEESHIMTMNVAGTRGYLAPEYATMGQLSEKADVYSFGVLVLEIVSGRKNIDVDLPPDLTYLSEWAWRLHNDDKLMDLIDPTLNLNNDEEVEVKQVINIALLCSQTDDDRRPTMAYVVAMLQGDTDVEGDVSNHSYREVEEQDYYSRLPMDGANLNLISIPEDTSVRLFGGPASSLDDTDSTLTRSFSVKGVCPR